MEIKILIRKNIIIILPIFFFVLKHLILPRFELIHVTSTWN